MGKKTDKIISVLRGNNNVHEFVQNNITSRFKVLNSTVKKWEKGIMMDKSNKWFPETFRKELHAGKSSVEISITFNFATVELLPAQWKIGVYNQLPSFEHKVVILAGWKASGISDNLTKSLAGIF